MSPKNSNLTTLTCMMTYYNIYTYTDLIIKPNTRLHGMGYVMFFFSLYVYYPKFSHTNKSLFTLRDLIMKIKILVTIIKYIYL